jgi:hypothetical protein
MSNKYRLNGVSHIHNFQLKRTTVGTISNALFGMIQRENAERMIFKDL